jgi:hypothetical protein
MKKIILLLSFFLFFACSQDSTQNTSSSPDGQGGSLAIFALKGNYLYGVDNFDLNVFSLINPSKPVVVNKISVGFNIETLFSFENNLYIGSRNGMYIYSLENPENPTLLSSVFHFTSCDPVVANATNAFVSLHSNTNCGTNINVLQIYDTSSITNPVLIHSRNLISPKGMALYGNSLLVCDDVIKIFDISNPVEPILINNINKECFDLIIRNNDLYAIGTSGVTRYLLNPSNPTDITLQSAINF